MSISTADGKIKGSHRECEFNIGLPLNFKQHDCCSQYEKHHAAKGKKK